MSDQFGFDFGEALPVYQEQPAGTWDCPAFTTAEYQALFARSDSLITALHDPARAMFTQGLAAAMDQHCKMLAHCDHADDEPYRLWRTTVSADAETRAAFLAFCVSSAGYTEPGGVVKIRKEMGMITTGMYVEGLGSIVLREWSNGNTGIDFTAGRDPFFLDSYRDDRHVINAPQAIWATCYCADKMAMEENANLPTFILNGREYINSGGLSSGGYRDCCAWTFCPITDWHGPTYSYSSQCQAWADGRTERGDLRGRLIRVRGRQCVIDGGALIFDENAVEPLYSSSSDDDELADADPDEDELLEALA